MTKEIRSSNVEKFCVARTPFSSLGFRHSFGFRHSSFGFENPCLRLARAFLIARRGRALRPDGNEMIPLVEMLANGRFKSTHDFLGQLVPRLTRAQRRAVVRYLREDVGGVAPVRARQIHR